MRQLLCIVVVLCRAAAAEDCPGDQQKNQATLLRIEQSWAQALERKDVGAVGCILAEDFEDAGVDGSLRNREETLAHVPERRPGSNTLSEMTAHIYGETAYIRGLNTVKDAHGNPVAKVRFTDLFIYGDGRWKAVAGHETLLSQPSK